MKPVVRQGDPLRPFGGEVLEGRIGTLHQFLDIQEDLCSQIADALVERADDGCLVPTTKRGFSAERSAS